MPPLPTGNPDMVLGTLISHPELLNRDTLYELRSIVARYPYFQTARLLMLNNLYLLHDPDFGTELRRSVLYLSDRRVLCRLIEGYADRVVIDEPGEEMEEPTVDRTMSLIDTFLGTLPKEMGGMSLVPEAVGDYAARFLMDDEAPVSTNIENTTSAPDDKGADSVLRALSLISERGTEISTAVSAESPMENYPMDAEESLEESYFTETLAKIYIKQRKYSRALEIIRSLYLQFPEKNTYFADQIRFLEKLIINNNLK